MDDMARKIVEDTKLWLMKRWKNGNHQDTLASYAQNQKMMKKVTKKNEYRSMVRKVMYLVNKLNKNVWIQWEN